MPRALQTILPRGWKSSTVNERAVPQLTSYLLLPLTSRFRAYTNKNTPSLTGIPLPSLFWNATDIPYFGQGFDSLR